jgi:hypothetical protein
MSNQPKHTEPLELADVLAYELAHIKGETAKGGEQGLEDIFEGLHEQELAALCFSGGGIRSATFGLGIVQSLAKHGLLDKFDYLSTVSGGGYLGSWLSAWIRREQLRILESRLTDDVQLFDAFGVTQTVGIEAVQEKLVDTGFPATDTNDPNPEPPQLQFLREYSNYMSPRVGLLSADTWTLIGIYLRNLFLNWTIFIPLISAVLLLPRFLFMATSLTQVGPLVAFSALMIGLVFAIISVAFVVSRLPSKNPRAATGDGSEPVRIKYDTDAWVMIIGILPLVVLAFNATTIWAWARKKPIDWSAYLNFLPSPLNHSIFYFVLFTIVVYFAGYLLYLVFKRRRAVVSQGGLGALSVSSVVGGILLWLASRVLSNTFPLGENFQNVGLFVCFAVPLFLLIFLIGATVFIGLSSKAATDADREWFARYGALVLMICVAWIVANVLVIFGPTWIEWIETKVRTTTFDLFSMDFWVSRIVPLIGVISGLLSLGGGFSGQSVVKDEPATSRLSKFLAVAPKIAAVVFFGFIFVGLAYISSLALGVLGNALNNYEWFAFAVRRVPGGTAAPVWFSIFDHATILQNTSIICLVIYLFALTLVGMTMAFFVNVNKFSLHGAYRDRLARSYLGASHEKRVGDPFTGFDDSDNFQLHRLKGQRPFHVINGTVNLVGGKNLAWQTRKAATFTMSPLHCGSWHLGYRHTNEYSRNMSPGKCKHLRYCNRLNTPCSSVEECELPGKALRLGTAMAISGAAANPNMGYYSSAVVTFLMSLFNIRLGWWLGNTAEIGDRMDFWGVPYYSKHSPSIAVLPLLNETLGRTSENRRYINVTDGGHFENLGLYEMVLRRCKYIVLSDAAADARFKLSDLSNAIQKCKVDLGVNIEFKDGIKIYSRVNAEGIEDKLRFAIGEITYPEKNRKGCLLYMKPTLYGDESTDMKYYARTNPSFPHQSTGDQLYDERQFEAYRSLGFFTMEQITGATTTKDLASLMNALCSAPNSEQK